MTDTRDTQGFQRTGAWLLGTGAAGLVATSVCYALAGPLAALPGGAISPAQAIEATPAAIGWMRTASLFGMPTDVLLALGAVMLAVADHRCRTAVVGWLTLAIASGLFIVVDGMVGWALPVAAESGSGSYAAWRGAFDGLFAFGALTAGAGALAASWSPVALTAQWKPACWAMRLAGMIGVLAGGGYLLWGVAAPVIGPGIALLALASLATAFSAAVELRPASSPRD